MTTSDNGGVDSFELECREIGKRNISVNDGLLYFSKNPSEQAISQNRGRGDKPDCTNIEEIKKFEGITRNFTYTMDYTATWTLLLLVEWKDEIINYIILDVF